MSVASAQGQETRTDEGKRLAVVELSTSYMRQKPDYESALETQELMGTVVEIVGEDGYWREIVSPQPYRAWVTEKGLVEMSAQEIEAYNAAAKYMFTGLYGHIYTEPSEKAATICDLVGGDVLRAVGKDGKALKGAIDAGKDISRKADDGNKIRKTDDRNKIHKALTKGKWAAVMLPSGMTGWVKKDMLKPLGERIDIRQGDSAEGLISAQKMEDIIASAMRLIGSPYLWGGMSAKGVDCSGLVRISSIMNDVLLPRNASQMIKCGTEVEILRPASPAQNDREVAQAGIRNLKRGDLVFFGTPATAEKPMRVTHVGIYLGNDRIIHSSHKVRINSLIPGDEDYYENAHRLIAARRLVNISDH